MHPLTDWRTSSFSGGENNACVAVANTLDAVRDSKCPDTGVLRGAVTTLLDFVKADRLRR